MDGYKMLISEQEIQQRVKELGEKITEDYKGKQPVIIGMLKGAVYFFTDLTRHIKLPLMIDFARLSSYKNGIVSGEMELVSNITTEITGKDVLIVEDIVDSGNTLSYFVKLLQQKNYQGFHRYLQRKGNSLWDRKWIWIWASQFAYEEIIKRF